MFRPTNLISSNFINIEVGYLLKSLTDAGISLILPLYFGPNIFDVFADI